MNTITNGNGTPAFNPNQVPIFEPNQVLKNTDLNSIVTYLDSHNRLTRTHLIGMGIVCGLVVQPSATLDEIRVTAGCGITSEGFFVQYLPKFDTANVDQYRFTHYRDQPLNKDRLISTESNEQQYLLQELITAKVASDNASDTTIHPLKDLDNLAQKVVLILCDWNDQPRDACLVDCDDRGRDRSFNLRFFLINKSQDGDSNAVSAEMLLHAGFDIPLEQTLAAAFQGWFNVPDCHIDRLGYPTQDGKQIVDPATILSFDDLVKAYYRVCKAGILSIDAAVQQTHALFGPFISTFRPDNTPFTNLKTRLKNILIGLVPVAIANADPFPGDTTPYQPTQIQVGYGIQYFYDYLVDLIAAFTKLKDALFDLMDDCMPDMTRFPSYLLAGEVAPATEDCPKPSLYRHVFYQPPIYNGNQQRKQEVRHLYERLVRMGESFVLLPFYQTPVKITPSRTRQAPLEQQAIPYYYNYPNIYPYWNYDACRKQRAAALPAYFRLNGLPSQRGYDLIPRLDWSDFLRIEGHVGLPLMEAIDRIKGYEQDFNLAFDLVAVRLGEVGPQGDPLLKGYFDDLELEFDQLKAIWEQQRKKIEKSIRDSTVQLILNSFDYFFFQYEDLAKIDPGLMENDLLKLARSASNYDVQAITGQPGHYRLIVNFNSTPARVAFVPSENSGDIQPNHPFHFTLTDADHFAQNRQHLIDTFSTCFSLRPTTLQVVPDGNNVFRFVVRDGRENIELLESPGQPNQDVPNLLLALEDETPYNPQGLVERYHDFDALFTFLKYFVERSESSDFEVSDFIPYYEFRALFHRYLLRLETVKKMQLFQEYAKQHRGLEHLGGVPNGGTFVLVYTSDPTVISRLVAADSSLLSNSDEKINALEKQARLPFGRLATNKRLAAIGSDRIGKNVVVADFCLPYLCCSPYSSLNYVMAQPRPFISLPQSIFCANDSTRYPFTLDPPGGLLTGGDGIVEPTEEKDQYAFQPDTVDIAITEPLNLTFFYIVNGVGSSFSVLMLPVANVTLSIAEGHSAYCVNPDGTQLIHFNATPPGGKFQLSVNNASYQDIAVDQNNFDLATIPFPENQNSLIVHFTYTVPNTDDYCGKTSDPLNILLVRQPQAQIEYDYDDSGAIGTLVYNPKNCSDLRLRVEFRGGGEAETYEWQLNSKKVADSRNATLEIPYSPGREGVVTLIVSNKYKKTICPSTATVNVVLPRLNPHWDFDSKLPTQPGNKKIIVLYRNRGRNGQELLTVQQPGGSFNELGGGLTISLRHTDRPCKEQTGYILNFTKAKLGIYTITYVLPDGSQFSRQVEVADFYSYSYGHGAAIAIGGELIASWEDK